ncbi:MAG: DUF4172 domain-containing protein [Bacteroidia bacterium]
MYNWQLPDWPNFTYESSHLEANPIKFAEQTGRISGMLQTLPENEQMDVIISALVTEAVKTSEIEGEYLSRQDVMSSIRNNLGLNPSR